MAHPREPKQRDPNDLGPRIRAMIESTRGDRQISAVAREAKITVDYLFALINGERGNPSLDVLKAVCAACGKTPAALYEAAGKKIGKSKD